MRVPFGGLRRPAWAWQRLADSGGLAADWDGRVADLGGRAMNLRRAGGGLVWEAGWPWRWRPALAVMPAAIFDINLLKLI